MLRRTKNVKITNRKRKNETNEINGEKGDKNLRNLVGKRS